MESIEPIPSTRLGGGAQGQEGIQDQKGEREICSCGRINRLKADHGWWGTSWWRGSKHQKHGGGRHEGPSTQK